MIQKPKRTMLKKKAGKQNSIILYLAVYIKKK